MRCHKSKFPNWEGCISLSTASLVIELKLYEPDKNTIWSELYCKLSGNCPTCEAMLSIRFVGSDSWSKKCGEEWDHGRWLIAPRYQCEDRGGSPWSGHWSVILLMRGRPRLRPDKEGNWCLANFSDKQIAWKVLRVGQDLEKGPSMVKVPSCIKILSNLYSF